jgi:general secretion pathway protein D
MRQSLRNTLLLCNATLALASVPAYAAPPRPSVPAGSPAPAPGPAGAPGIAGAGGPAGAAGQPAVGANGKPLGDTAGLGQFESGVEYEPRAGTDRVSFSLEDADLPDLVRVIGELTGKRFIFGGKVHNIKATVFSPQKVTVAEAYQAFLSILDANGLTVVPHGRF